MAKLKEGYPHLLFYLVLVDLGKTRQIMEQVPDILKRAPDISSFKMELLRLERLPINRDAMKEHIKSLYQNNPLAGSFCITDPISYRDLRQLSEKGGLIVISQDLVNPQIAQAFRKALDDNDVALDACYYSNLHEYSPPKGDVSLRQSIMILSGNDDPLLINSRRNKEPFIVQDLAGKSLEIERCVTPLIQQIERRNCLSLENEISIQKKGSFFSGVGSLF